MEEKQKREEVQNALKVMNTVLQGNTFNDKNKRKRSIKHHEKLKQHTDKLKNKSHRTVTDTTVETNKTVEISSSFIPDCVFKPSNTMFKGETPYVALDCEMVETDGRNDALAR